MNNIEILNTVNNDFNSYQKLISLYQKYKNVFGENINLAINGFFSANTCAMLGSILYLLQNNLNTINIEADKINYSILYKNNFLSFFGHEKILDTNNTTISYNILSTNSDKYFNNYIYSQLLNKNDLPKMSILLKEKIGESIYEIFNNAVIHSKTNKIFTCGQFFPNKKSIEFMITDIGIGIKGSIKEKFNKDLNAIQSILWAIEDKNTTKDVTGGIGFALLHEFIKKNNGKIQIISNDGFYQFANSQIITNEFNSNFPGTIINISINTNDTSLYTLNTENEDVPF